MLEILPSVLVQKKLKLDTVERIMGPFPAPKFKFVYEADFFPVRGGEFFYRVIDVNKNNGCLAVITIKDNSKLLKYTF